MAEEGECRKSVNGTPLFYGTVVECSICTELLTKELIATACGHVFHAHCIEQWHVHAQRCPICRSRSTSASSICLHFRMDEKILPNVTGRKEHEQHMRELNLENKVLDLKEEVKAGYAELEKEKELHTWVQEDSKKWKKETEKLKEQLRILQGEFAHRKKKYADLKTGLKAKVAALQKLQEKESQLEDFVRMRDSLQDADMQTLRELRSKAKTAVETNDLINAQHLINQQLYKKAEELEKRNKEWYQLNEALRRQTEQRAQDLNLYAKEVLKLNEEKELLRNEKERLLLAERAVCESEATKKPAPVKDFVLVEEDETGVRERKKGRRKAEGTGIGRHPAKVERLVKHLIKEKNNKGISKGRSMSSLPVPSPLRRRQKQINEFFRPQSS
eukprot:GHVS01047994.1.p1 GENE.GHVS01047994.1~~GHVS01047994.1.p1  ORF type:complete len:388 (-),score=64.57 GHVS01047994.1:137-1300(-)